MRTAWLTLMLVVWFLMPGPHARAEPYSACAKNLSSGKNRFGVKVNRSALGELISGLKYYRRFIRSEKQALLIDYSRNSQFRRAYLIDFEACDVLAYEYVIHGGLELKPKKFNRGEPKRDGQLQHCRRPDGTRSYLTRPGFYVTAGCHVTRQSGWTVIYDRCYGIKLHGLEEGNREALAAGIVLHEHVLIPNDNSIKPLSQGCPAFPPERLKSMIRFEIQNARLVHVFAPNCGTSPQ